MSLRSANQQTNSSFSPNTKSRSPQAGQNPGSIPPHLEAGASPHFAIEILIDEMMSPPAVRSWISIVIEPTSLDLAFSNRADTQASMVLLSMPVEAGIVEQLQTFEASPEVFPPIVAFTWTVVAATSIRTLVSDLFHLEGNSGRTYG